MSWRQLFLSSPAYFTLSTIWIVSCGQPSEQPPTTQGVLSEVDGVVRLLNSAEERQLCSVQYCEPNYVYHTHFARKRKEPDPLNEELIDYSKAIMNVPQAWELTQGDSNVVVAVIDSGVDYTHSDLRENMWLNALEELGEPGVDDDENGYVDDVYGWDFHNNRPNAMDDNRHGTHVAGTIAAAADGHGTIGVAPKVRVMPLKFLSAAGGGSTLNAIRAIEYAVKNGAQVISNSWGGPYYSKFLEEAVLKAQAQGAILVAAAGLSLIHI